MSYTTELATLVAGQLERLATYNAHELAGQLPNVEFWFAEAAHALGDRRLPAPLHPAAQRPGTLGG